MDDSTPETKVCKICGQEKPLTDFYKHSSNHDGYRNECKRCNLNRRGHEARYIAPDGMKRCSACKRVLPITNEFFGRDRTTCDGFQSSCKSCHRLYEIAWLDRNRDTDKYRQNNRDRVKRWRLDNPEKARLMKKAYYQGNKATIRVKQREYNQSHKDQYRVSKGNWAKANRAKRNAISRNYIHRRRSILLSLPNTFTEQDWQHCLDYWHHCCAVCGRPVGLWHTLAQDHWVAITDPRPDNPGNVAANIVPLCHGLDGCNNSKSNRDAVTWLIARVGRRRAKDILARINLYFQSIN